MEVSLVQPNWLRLELANLGPDDLYMEVSLVQPNWLRLDWPT